MENQALDIIMQENLQVIAKLRLLDDDLMTLVFDKNIEATELLLSILLQRTDLKVLEVVAQKEYKNPMAGGRSIILDIYAKDADNKVYNIEVQRSDRGSDFHRARFHSSMIDSKMLKEKQDFRELHDSYVIFITENDVIGAGQSLYHVDRVIKETGDDFEDGSHIIYVNGNYKNDDDPIGKLMHDFRCISSEDMYYPLLARQVRHFKETEGGQKVVCKAVEELVEKRAEKRAEELVEELVEKRAEKLAEKRAEECVLEDRKRTAKLLLSKGNMSAEEIAAVSCLSVDEVKELVGF